MKCRNMYFIAYVFLPVLASGLLVQGMSYAQRPKASRRSASTNASGKSKPFVKLKKANLDTKNVSMKERKRYGRRVSFEALNDTGQLRQMPTFVGRGALPLRLSLNDLGNWNVDRSVKVFVAVYSRPDPKRIQLGGLVTTYLDPGIMTTPAGKEQKLPYGVDIPLAPGDYLFYIFLCDSNVTYNVKRHKQYFPNADQFPGLVLKAKLCAARVDPR